MKISIYVSLVCIALCNPETNAMHKPTSPVNDRAALKQANDGVPGNRKKLSISDQELGNKLRTVLKTVPSGSLNSEFSDESGESDSQQESSSPPQTPLPEQPRNATSYPAQRLMLGLTVEWLQTLPHERISLEGVDSGLLTPEQKHQLIEHVRATHNAVRHTLDIADRTLAIDVNKLPEPLKAFMQSQSEQSDQVTKTQVINVQAPSRSFLSTPIVTGGVCFVLGYLLAKKVSNVSH